VLYGALSKSRRVRLHHQIALALERLSATQEINPAELAHHLREALPIAGREPARRASIAAGRHAASVFAYEEAAEQYRRALEIFGPDEEAARCDVMLALGRVQWHAGDDEARVTFLSAAKSARRRGDADQLARAALGIGERYFEVTYLGAYRDLLEVALEAIGDADSPRRALLLSRLAVNRAFPSEDEQGLVLAADAVEMARRIGDEKLLAAVLLCQHVTLLDVGHIHARLALGEELASLTDNHQELAAEGHHWRMYDLLGIGAVEAARHEFTQLDALARSLGQPLLRSLADGARGLWAELAGDVESAERHAQESLRQAQLAHTGDAWSSWASQMFATRRRQGRIAELGPLVERLANSGGHQLGWLSALGLLRFETGDHDAARSIYEREMRNGGELPRGMFRLTRLALLAELCAKLGDTAGAEALYGQLAPHAECNVVVAYCSVLGPVDGYLAMLAETAGDVRLAARHVRTALARTRAMQAPLLTEDLEARYETLRRPPNALV
jgi:tetratricopeptide (TPR) repeat protein